MTFQWQYPKKQNAPHIYTQLREWMEKTTSTRTFKQFVVLYGKPGNGKTSIAKQLAVEFNLDLQVITIDDVFDSSSYNECLKGLNLTKIGSTKSKLILVDDVDDFSMKKEMFNIALYTSFPIIFTCGDLYTIKDFFDRESAITIEIMRPTSVIIEDILKEECQRSNFSYTTMQLREIAKESKSIRSALLALFLGYNDNDFVVSTSFIGQLKKRSLEEHVDFGRFFSTIKHIRTYNDINCSILQRFALFDYMFNFDPWSAKSNMARLTHGKLDKKLFELIPEKIEEVQFSSFEKPREVREKIKEKKKEKKDTPTFVQNHIPIESFF